MCNLKMNGLHDQMKNSSDKTAVVIVAGGQGTRALRPDDPDIPKQYQYMHGQTVIARTIRTFIDHDEVDYVLPVIASNAYDLYLRATKTLDSDKLLRPTNGGDARQQSVKNGLDHLQELSVGKVLIHDAARPFVTPELVSKLVEKLDSKDGSIAAQKATDTIKKTKQGTDIVLETISREDVWFAQTPQAFKFETIHRLHDKYKDEEFTDDAQLFEHEGLELAIVESSKSNFKITQPEDFKLAAQQLDQKSYEFRTGQGYDVHAFEPGDAVTLCGVSIPHFLKLKGHSDADVAMHALTDALYGSIGYGDIGQHFPPSDDQWKGAKSDIFLQHAVKCIEERNAQIINCDITIICEAPKISPHSEAMRRSLSTIMNIAENRISIKATTTEQLGFTGRGEGIAALATVSVKVPDGEM